MKIFNELLLKFEKSDWSTNSEFCVIDTILESRPDIILILKSDIIGSERASIFGRQDTFSVEQIVCASIFKEIHRLNYRELEYAQNDSRIYATFVKLNGREPYSFQMFKNTSRVLIRTPSPCTCRDKYSRKDDRYLSWTGKYQS